VLTRVSLVVAVSDVRTWKAATPCPVASSNRVRAVLKRRNTFVADRLFHNHVPDSCSTYARDACMQRTAQQYATPTYQTHRSDASPQGSAPDPRGRPANATAASTDPNRAGRQPVSANTERTTADVHRAAHAPAGRTPERLNTTTKRKAEKDQHTRQFKIQNARRPIRTLAAAAKARLHTANKNRQCGFCSKLGHHIDVCPALPTPIPDSFTPEQRAFTAKLLDAP
jgi:hypothetical protein